MLGKCKNFRIEKGFVNLVGKNQSKDGNKTSGTLFNFSGRNKLISSIFFR